MFIRSLDYLSPRVTFYHKGFLSHNSIISGILSIIAIVFIIILAVYFSLELIQRNEPNAFYFNTFTEDAGTFEINKTSLFHFITMAKNIEGAFINDPFDFTLFNIAGVKAHYENWSGIQKRGGLKTVDHWLYGYCNKEKNTEGLDDLLTYDFFEKSACLKKYYNSTVGKYYDIGDENFVWPEIAHGTFNENSKIYSIIVQQCDNNIIKTILGDEYECKNEAEINSFFNIRGSRIFHLYFLNYYINILNYKNPNFKFFYRIENPLYGNQYSSNNLNFNTALIKTHDGLVLDNVKEEISYILNRNDVYTGNFADNNIYIAYGFFLKNIMDYYERSYKRIQDVISSIGGINQAITIFAIYLNTLYNHFIVLYDTENLLHSSIHIEKKNNFKKSIKYEQLKKLKDLEKQKKNNEIREKTNTQIYNNANPNPKLKNSKIENDNPSTSKNNFNCLNKDLFLEQIKKIEGTNNTKKDDNKNDRKGKKFLHFICFKFSCGKNYSCFKIYEDFRIKIISEEHLIRNHLNIYNLLKVTEKKRNYRRNSYQLKDLINLI